MKTLKFASKIYWPLGPQGFGEKIVSNMRKSSSQINKVRKSQRVINHESGTIEWPVLYIFFCFQNLFNASTWYKYYTFLPVVKDLIGCEWVVDCCTEVWAAVPCWDRTLTPPDPIWCSLKLLGDENVIRRQKVAWFHGKIFRYEKSFKLLYFLQKISLKIPNRMKIQPSHRL